MNKKKQLLFKEKRKRGLRAKKPFWPSVINRRRTIVLKWIMKKKLSKAEASLAVFFKNESTAATAAAAINQPISFWKMMVVDGLATICGQDEPTGEGKGTRTRWRNEKCMWVSECGWMDGIIYGTPEQRERRVDKDEVASIWNGSQW
jgi:hypothetical protein